MPNIQIQDPFGYMHVIHSSNPDTIAAWFVEMTKKFVTVNSSLMPLQMRIYPMSVQDEQGQMQNDWAVHDQTWYLPPDKFLDRLIESLQLARDDMRNNTRS